MQDPDINLILKDFLYLPKFPDGRIDFTHSNIAPVINCFVRYNGKILLLKRSEKVGSYRRKWNAVAGYIDELKPLGEKILEELKEELNITKKDIEQMKIMEGMKFIDGDIEKTWIVHHALAELKDISDMQIDWEHSEYRWIRPEEIHDFDIVPNLHIGLKRVLK